MGTIAAYAEDHSDSYASEVLLELQEFRSVGEFMLTEVAHGSDASNLETTATYNNDGSFDLHTPNPMAAKSMPPTSPEAGMPRIAVVFAQLIVNGEHRGIRPFIVRLCDADKMAPGISSRLLPRRNGPKYVDHCITMFNHVRLEPSAFLGTLNAAKDLRGEPSRQVHRLTVGALCLAMSSIPILRVTAFVLGRYGQRQHVAGPKLGEKVPKAYFASQHGPALVALTLSSVLEAYAATVWEEFCWEEQPQLRDSLAGIFKTAAAIDSQSVLKEITDRCGWQGLYTHNQITELASSFRGNWIAEGDFSLLCSRKYSMKVQLALNVGLCNMLRQAVNRACFGASSWATKHTKSQKPDITAC